MSYTIKRTTKFKKDYKIAVKRKMNVKKLEEIVTLLAEGKPLPAELLDHPLFGEYVGCRECHVENDWLLIYRYEKDVLVLGLQRLGTHSDVFRNF